MNGKRDSRMPTPPYVRLGRKVIYLRDDLDRWLEAQRWDGRTPFQGSAKSPQLNQSIEIQKTLTGSASHD
jgi:hypothetical protein